MCRALPIPTEYKLSIGLNREQLDGFSGDISWTGERKTGYYSLN